MKKLFKKMFGVSTLVLSVFMFNSVCVNAEDNIVAKIGDIGYTTLDEAVNEATTGDVIELLADVTTNGLNLSKDLTITSAEKSHYTITFIDYGIALWGKSLTFKDVDVVMNGIGSTPYKAEWNWMTICASKNSSLNLINSNMTMDGKDAGNKHAIYFTGNDKLNLTDSTLTIKNYQQDALEWDGGDGGYNVNIINSTFLSDHNRSGFTGTFIVTVDESKVDVVNSTGNGSNGSHFVTVDSEFNFSNNGSCGLSAGSVNSTNTNFILNNNGMAGLVINSIDKYSKFDKDSKVYIDNTGANIYGAFSVAANVTFETGSVLKVTNNKTVGIRVLEGILSWIGKDDINGITKGNLTVEEGVTFEVTNNINDKEIFTSRIPTNYSGSTYGGGIWANGTVTLPSDAVIYNNHSLSAGDDIYVENGGKITFGNVGKEWYLDGNPDCYDSHTENYLLDRINGWYEDGVVQDEDGNTYRWMAHAENIEDNHIIVYESGTYTGELALKAAHNLKGEVITDYVDEDGNAFTYTDDEGEEQAIIEESTGYVGEDYNTDKKDFENYELVKVVISEDKDTDGISRIEIDAKDLEEAVNGKYINDTLRVTYIYRHLTGDVIIRYVDTNGNELASSETTTGNVGEEYKTSSKEFDGYVLVRVTGKENGTYSKDTTEIVTYVYEYVLGVGGGEEVEVLPPKTGGESSTTDTKNYLEIILILIVTILTRKFV